MKSIWNDGDRRELRARVQQLTPQHAAKWGKFTAPQMVAHLCDSMRMASSELPVAAKNLPIRYPPLKQLIIYWLPFPKSAPTAPELLVRSPGDFAADRAELERRIDETARRGPSALAPQHPAFGAMNDRLWGVLIYRHVDHHLRQFGV
jgi:hypothetical protein